MRGPTLIKTFTAVGAAALLTTGCLSSGSDTASTGAAAPSGSVSGSKVTIWTSVDKPVMDGMKAVTDAKAEELGMTVEWSKVDNINQLIMTKIQANDTPDIALIPQPGVVADIVTRGKATPLDDVVDMAALKASMIPGTLESGTVNDKLYGLLTSANAKSFVFYNKKASTPRATRPPRRSPSSTPWPRRSRPTRPLPLPGAWASAPKPPPDGRPPTGSKT